MTMFPRRRRSGGGEPPPVGSEAANGDPSRGGGVLPSSMVLQWYRPATAEGARDPGLTGDGCEADGATLGPRGPGPYLSIRDRYHRRGLPDRTGTPRGAATEARSDVSDYGPDDRPAGTAQETTYEATRHHRDHHPRPALDVRRVRARGQARRARAPPRSRSSRERTSERPGDCGAGTPAGTPGGVRAAWRTHQGLPRRRPLGSRAWS